MKIVNSSSFVKQSAQFTSKRLLENKP